MDCFEHKLCLDFVIVTVLSLADVCLANMAHGNEDPGGRLAVARSVHM
jgi:hypothetical protein